MNYLTPTGMVPTYSNIQNQNHGVQTMTSPIAQPQKFINKEDVTAWTNTKREQFEIEKQEADHFFVALRKVIGKVQEQYELSDKNTRIEAWNKTRDVLSDKWA